MKSTSTLRLSTIVFAIALSSAHAADVTLLTGTYTDTQTYNNGVIGQPNSNIITFGSGANYTFDSLYVSFAWNRMILNSGATLNVGGNLGVDLSGVSLNGGTLTAGGLQLHDGPDGWEPNQNDGKQTIQPADSIINGSTIIANQSNANFISFVSSSSAPWANGYLTNNLWLGNDGATINSNGHDIGITMALGNFSGQTGSLTKVGEGTLTLSGSNTYTGTTTVNEGILKVDTPSFSDSSAVVIAFGAKIDLNYAGNDIVGRLVIDGTTVPSGSYNASHPTYGSYFAGTGSLQVGATGPEVSGTWTDSSGSNWSDSTKWQSGNVANGTNNTAAFNPGAPVTVTVDGNRYIGALSFTGFDATLDGTSVLTLDNTSATQPQVSVASGLTATLATNIGGTLGLEKTGSGTLVLTGIKSYTGGTTVTGGTLELAGAMNGNGQIHGSLNIQPGASVNLSGGDGTGLGWNDPVTSVNIDSGTINASGGSHLGFGSSGSMTVNNGSTVLGNWQWNGDGRLGFASYGDSTNTISGNLVLRADDGATHTFYVDNGAAANDLLISANLSDQWPEVGWAPASGFAKSGAGTLVMSGINTYDGNTVIDDGALNVTASGSLHFRPTTNGVTNSVSGSASAKLSFLGTVDLDLTAATTTIGNSWNLFNLASFSGPAPVLNPAAVTTTTLGSFTLVSPGVWELPVTGAKWTFSAATGNLTFANTATPYETWGAAYGLTAGSETGDLDNDGMTNGNEYAFGLIPNSGASVNPIAVQLNKTTGTFSYTRRQQSLTGLTYTVWYSTDLATWTQDTGAVQGTPVLNGEVETVPATISAALLANPKLFVQIRAQ